MMLKVTLDNINAYIYNHINPGDFLYSVFCNDLIQSIHRADSFNLIELPNIVQYLWSHAPYDCWGSEKKVDEWLKNS